jgi:hypothetical protein
LRVSNSGLAISQNNYEMIMKVKANDNNSKAKRTIRQAIRDDDVRLSELLSRLQGEAAYQDHQIRTAIENMMNMFCESNLEQKLSKNLWHMNPTLLAREKLENNFLEAIWIDKNTLEF